MAILHIPSSNPTGERRGIMNVFKEKKIKKSSHGTIKNYFSFYFKVFENRDGDFATSGQYVHLENTIH